MNLRILYARSAVVCAVLLLAEAKAQNVREDLQASQAKEAPRLQVSRFDTHSFERRPAPDGTRVAKATSSAAVPQATNQQDKTPEPARGSGPDLPPDPSFRTEYAAGLDELHKTSEALAAWRRVLEVQPDSGRAHLRIAQLLLESGNAAAAEQAANIGLGAVPKFAALYMVKADALEKEGQLYSARKALEEGAANVHDPMLLRRSAAADDTYGGLAADAYAHFVETLGASSPERVEALERGFAVSMRDADFKHAESFAGMLESAGQPQFRKLIGVQQHTESGTLIPGGLDALAFAAHGKEGVSPEKFLVEYCKTLIDLVPEQPTPASKQYAEGIQEYFQRIAALQALGERKDNRVVITLSTNGRDADRNTEKVLSLLGMELRNTKGVLELARREKKNQAKKQETSSALAIDEVGMEEALKAGKPYTFEIPYEWAAVYPNEKLWRETFYSSDSWPGGIATAMLRTPKMARVYVGLSSLDEKTVSELLSAVDLRTLEERYADLIYLYGPAFAIQGTHAVVPGGPRAEGIWTSLAGASPAQPGTFFRSLLDREGGRLLAFFFALSQVDRPHQEFFTANASRTTQFYRYFAESDETRRGVAMVVLDSAFTRLLRSLPLDANGHVNFPGSAEAWTEARGRSSSGVPAAKNPNTVSKAAAPEVEDQLLLQLAQTRYKVDVIRHSELENFLAVARIDAHRVQPLDEQSAVLLAQNYAEFSPAYAYFAEITGLGYSDYERFFAAVERIKSHSVLETNLQLGQFHSLIEWICLLRRRQVMDENGAAKLFRYVCDRFATADSPSGYTVASLNSARAILGYCKPEEKILSADEKIRSCMSGSYSQTESPSNIGWFQRVLDLQKVPSLDVVFEIYDGVAAMSTKGPQELAEIKKGVDGLPVVELPKDRKATGKEKDSVIRYEPRALQKHVAELAMRSGNKNADSRETEKVSQELLAELQPQVTLALAGKVYAYFLRSSDLVVMEDPLLLRKHHYFNFDTAIIRKEFLPESNFSRSSEGLGSYFVGGFAQFGLAAGTAAAIGWKTAGPGGSESMAAQIAAIRSATWDRLRQSDQRLVSLRIAVAREWIFESALQPDAFRALGEETMGLLSLSRRADLLTGIESRNWRRAWDSITLPDLFVLGGRYLNRFKTDPWSSPVTAALRSAAAANDGSRLNIVGGIAFHSFGCTHPHLLVDAPYEDYERQLFSTELAERSAEFKLFLSYQADNQGVEPSALAGVAETLASMAFRSAHMRDSQDWRSLLDAFGTIMPRDIEQALEQ